MKTKSFFQRSGVFTILIFALFLMPFALYSQSPQGFNYQAVVRDAEGQVVKDQAVGLRLTILQGSESGTAVYSETHQVVTNAFGVVTMVVGRGNAELGDFSTIDWESGPYFLKVEADLTGGSNYETLGVSALMSVPYALQAGTVGSLTRLEVQGDDPDSDSALFVVRRKDGQVVFAVYNEGVRIYVDTASGAKGPRRGGFAIGGFGMTKGAGQEYLRVTPDSVRIYINDADAKGPRGGFAIGGFDFGKGITHEFLRVTDDSTRVYVSNESKGPRGGFAIGGFDFGKGRGVTDYFNVNTGSSVGVINPSQARILWYPQKEAFMTGRVLVESPDSVGTNSLATGFESKAVGNYSQALGYQARAGGNNASAIGNHANATGEESYALGNYAFTGNTGAYAIGSGATARGLRSFAIGSVGIDSAGVVTAPTQATGDYAYAFGMGCLATGRGAFAMGTQNIAEGRFSMALGYNTRALGTSSMAMGWRCIASGDNSVALGAFTYAGGNATALGSGSIAKGYSSVAMGYMTKSTGDFSTALCGNTVATGMFSLAGGYGSKAYGDYATAMGSSLATGHWATATGRGTTARAFCSFVAGAFNDTVSSSSIDSWVETDPLFIIGNGTASNRHNAMLVKKNGEVYFPEVYNSTVGLLRRELYVSIGGKLGYVSSSRRYKKKIRSLEDVQWLYQLRPVSFVYKSDPSGTEQYGLIAEEVEKVNPLFVSYDRKGQVETVSYSQLITPMLKALQEQKERIDELEKENAELLSLRREVEELKKILGAMAEK